MPEHQDSPIGKRVIRTARGDIEPDQLGITSLHEHVVIEFGSVLFALRSPEHTWLRDLPVTIETVPDVRWNSLSVLDNMTLENEEIMKQEVRMWREAGGDAIVDLTSTGLAGDPEAVSRICEAAGVRVIFGFGHYVHRGHDPAVCEASVDELSDLLDLEAREGVQGSKILPGTLGEIGMSHPPTDCERNALRAAARVAHRYNMSLHIHVDNGGEHAPQHVADCAEEGLPPSRVVCGHMDERLDRRYHIEILRLGACLGFDTFGEENYFSGVYEHPSDGMRMTHLKELIDLGYLEQIVVAHDVGFKVNLHRYGGNGFDHLLTRIVPALELSFGMGKPIVDQLLIENPRRLLSCTPPLRDDSPLSRG